MSFLYENERNSHVSFNTSYSSVQNFQNDADFQKTLRLQDLPSRRSTWDTNGLLGSIVYSLQELILSTKDEIDEPCSPGIQVVPKSSIGLVGLSR